MTMNLMKDVFWPVAKQVKSRAASLRQIKKRFACCGIEAWLKVEVVAALREHVSEVRNNGPDLKLSDGTEIELKAATDFNPSYLCWGSIKYGGYCLFLADGGNDAHKERLEEKGVRLIACDVFSDGRSKWMIGMIAPSRA